MLWGQKPNLGLISATNSATTGSNPWGSKTWLGALEVSAPFVTPVGHSLVRSHYSQGNPVHKHDASRIDDKLKQHNNSTSSQWKGQYNEKKDMSRTDQQSLALLQEPAGHRHHPGCSSQALLAPSSPTNKRPTNLEKGNINICKYYSKVH